MVKFEKSSNEYEKWDEYEKSLLTQVKRPSSLMTMFSDLLESIISKIPHDFSMLSKLKQLFIFKCKTLESIPELPSRIIELHCKKCHSLTDLSSLKILTKLQPKDCEKLKEIRGLDGTESLEELDAQGCYNWTCNPRNKHYEVLLPLLFICGFSPQLVTTPHPWVPWMCVGSTSRLLDTHP
ncbi:hypothetical protein NE237_001466 [Protea cynaroides]|uniref:Uncharacterized protein n=1 Tax=Protea cynaroides TaxID=273540 RepID=A0A9Q0QY52_9MAGN|nr:hypothetical protein NE237_001466 [Protea cynaroides]